MLQHYTKNTLKLESDFLSHSWSSAGFLSAGYCCRQPCTCTSSLICLGFFSLECSSVTCGVRAFFQRAFPRARDGFCYVWSLTSIGFLSSFRHKSEWLRKFVPLGSGEGKEKVGFPPCTRIQSSHLKLTAQAAGLNSFSKADLDALLCGFKE